MRLPLEIRSLSLLAICLTLVTGSGRAATVDFAKDIQPIFARHCYECHGAEQQKGKLRLDDRTSVFRAESRIIVARKPDESELLRRISLPKGHDDVMPSRGDTLSPAKIATIKAWIASGADWPENVQAVKHWAYIPPRRPLLPEAKNRNWPRNPIDHFILARLEAEKLRPSTESDKVRLLRRVYLDLTGLPPSPAQVEAFLADKSEEAYEKAVDALLASPHYGERWARPWLDLARYADSNGFQRDNLWSLWPYRDWVIRALNADMPFDQFTIEQIAGDLLPNATLDQKVATGFNRATATNIEAGSDQEETRVNQILDRVNTIGTVWLGSTLECAQCHNHKYDPFSQKEYYQLFAFFNNTPIETDRLNPNATAALKFTGPYMDIPDASIEKRQAAMREKIAAVDEEIRRVTNRLLTGKTAWEDSLTQQAGKSSQTHVLEISEFNTESDSLHEVLADKSILLRSDPNSTVPETDVYTATARTSLTGITGFKLEALIDPALPGNGPGRGDSKRPNFVVHEFSVSILRDEKLQPLKLRNGQASFEQKNFGAAAAIDGNPETGWAISPQFYKDHWATFETAESVGTSGGTTLVFKIDQHFGAGRTIGRLRLSAMTGNAADQSIPADVARILAINLGERSKEDNTRLTNYFLDQQPELRELRDQHAKLTKELKSLDLPQTLVMQEMQEPRMTKTFVRGNFLEQGEAVEADVPAILHPMTDERRNRLALAKWLISTNNPLVARVTVNRWWMEIFGHGLVTTPEDFGIKGELPTHPDLLDWLAVEFMEHRWSMKHIHKLIVTSATYRQSSVATPELLKRDDQNKLYGRGPRFRMDAEMIRDHALAAAGLLSLKLGGPPVRPYQPPGIWENKVGGEPVTYDISEGEDRYRRGLYTVWKRTSPYPSFITFDAPNRNSCVVRRPRSNTPLQALTLLNDPVYVEAAKALANRVLNEKKSAPINDKLSFAFQLCTGRIPQVEELDVLSRLYNAQLNASREDAVAAKKLSGDTTADAAELAAWYSIATALLNLDETITKG